LSVRDYLEADQVARAPERLLRRYQGGRAAAAHLLALGHQRIGLICGRTDLNDRALQRRIAFEQMLRDAKIEPDPELMFERTFEFEEGRAAMQRMLKLDCPPTAVFCAADVQAIGALAECRDAGLSVPDKMSIVGFDDMPIAQHVTPKLTTVRVPAQEMGDSSAKHLIAAIETGTPVRPLDLSTELVIRETTARYLAQKTRRRAPALQRYGGVLRRAPS